MLTPGVNSVDLRVQDIQLNMVYIQHISNLKVLYSSKRRLLGENCTENANIHKQILTEDYTDLSLKSCTRKK